MFAFELAMGLLSVLAFSNATCWALGFQSFEPFVHGVEGLRPAPENPERDEGLLVNPPGPFRLPT
jgi:hypothetical protein